MLRPAAEWEPLLGAAGVACAAVRLELAPAAGRPGGGAGPRAQLRVLGATVTVAVLVNRVAEGGR